MTQKDNRGAIFKNDKKSKPNDPDGKGQGMVNGVEVWIAAWNEVSKDGKTKYYSLAFTPKDAQQQPGSAPAASDPGDESVPF